MPTPKITPTDKVELAKQRNRQRMLKMLNERRADLKARAELGEEGAIKQLAQLRNLDKLRKRYTRAKKAYELAKQGLA